MSLLHRLGQKLKAAGKYVWGNKHKIGALATAGLAMLGSKSQKASEVKTALNEVSKDVQEAKAVKDKVAKYFPYVEMSEFVPPAFEVVLYLDPTPLNHTQITSN